MDLTSAVKFLTAYEASLKLAPGQKPPPPSPSLFDQLSAAVDALATEIANTDLRTPFSGIPPSARSDWPLCCGLDLTSKELQAARSLPPSLLRERGLLSLFLALHSCAIGGVYGASGLAPKVLRAATELHNVHQDDPAPFPSAHLAARVGHRLINADDALDFPVDSYGRSPFDMWEDCLRVPSNILYWGGPGPNHVLSALPHKAAGLSLAKEMAVVLDALCAAQRPDSEGEAAAPRRGQSNRLPFILGCEIVSRLSMMLKGAKDRIPSQCIWDAVFEEAHALPAYNPVLLLETFDRKIDSPGLDHGYDKSFGKQMGSIELSRITFWKPLVNLGSKLRPADAHTAMRLGLKSVDRQQAMLSIPWQSSFIAFAAQALQLGLVQPELILRARPQLLEGLVEGLARGRYGGEIETSYVLIRLVCLMARSPAVGFHLRKFFSRSGCLQVIQKTSDPEDLRWELIRTLGPRAAQDPKPYFEPLPLVQLVANARDGVRDVAQEVDPMSTEWTCDSIARYLTLDILREPSHAQVVLQYLSELAEETAAPRRPNAQYGVLMIVWMGKACLAVSNSVAAALQDVREGPKKMGGRGPGGVGASRAGIGQNGWRARLVTMGRQLSLLRRRVLHELLPLAEAREAALWEGMRVEEVVAALTGSGLGEGSS